MVTSVKEVALDPNADPASALVGGTGEQELVGHESNDRLRKDQADLMRAQLDRGKNVSVPDGKDYPNPTGYDPDTGRYDARLEGRTHDPLPIQKQAPGPQFAMGGNLSHPKAAHPRVFGRSALPPRPRG